MFLFIRDGLFLAWATWLRLLLLRKHRGLRKIPRIHHYEYLGLLQFSTYDDKLNYVVCFFGVRRRFLNAFEHKGKCRKATIAVIIRLT